MYAHIIIVVLARPHITTLHYNIVCFIASYRIVSYRIVSYRIVSYTIIL